MAALIAIAIPRDATCLLADPASIVTCPEKNVILNSVPICHHLEVSPIKSPHIPPQLLPKIGG